MVPARRAAVLWLVAVAVLSACFPLGPSHVKEAIGRPMYQVDPQHTGRSPHSGPVQLDLLRTFESSYVPVPDPATNNFDIQSSAAIAPDGTAYIGLHNGTVFALRDPPGPGDQLAARWSFHPPGASSWHATPAIGQEGSVYVGFSTNNTSPDAEGTLYALRAPSRGIQPDIAWSAPLGPGRQTSSPTIGGDGTIYAMGGNGRLSAISPDGQVKWTVQTGPILKSSPALGRDGTVYVSSMNGKLYAVAPPPAGQGQARIRWTFRFAEFAGNTPPVVSHSPPAGADGIGSGGSPMVGPDGSVYVGANNSNLYAVSPQGQLVWMFEAEREIAGIWSTPALSPDGSLLYFGANKGGIYALDRQSGTLRWQFPIVGSVYSSVAVGADGTVYTASSVGHVFALDGATGRQLLDFNANAAIWTAPAIRPDGTLVVADRTGRVMLLGRRN
jgi:outer membrane protein assembly factor BamB